MGEMIDVTTLDGNGTFAAYRAQPAGMPKAAIVVIQEVFGVNPGIRAKCDRWAQAGYLALAPDLFWRTDPGLLLDADVPGDLDEGIAAMMKFDADVGMRDIEAVIRAARAGAGGGKVGIVGYCFGGGIAYLAATRTDVDAAVGYYGGQIHAFLGESKAIGKPVLLHFAERDHFIDAEKLVQIHAALDANPHVEIEEYAGVDHGFATESGQRRDDAAAALADRRTADFFARHLA